ncbi:hypothetical protein CMI42_05365 [Candidatus Pacearchaeota archaeon]|nr:hypothetical protein [Candidatus Pacearchaeota archaeon]|tara:strand:+ start:1300 stop:1887 length:588 start_codon:yes stop_codon:yes gene_type:complete
MVKAKIIHVHPERTGLPKMVETPTDYEALAIPIDDIINRISFFRLADNYSVIDEEFSIRNISNRLEKDIYRKIRDYDPKVVNIWDAIPLFGTVNCGFPNDETRAWLDLTGPIDRSHVDSGLGPDRNLLHRNSCTYFGGSILKQSEYAPAYLFKGFKKLALSNGVYVYLPNHSPDKPEFIEFRKKLIDKLEESVID